MQASTRTDAGTDDESAGHKYALMDKLDESQVIAEMEGKTIETFFYEFTDRGQKRIGLSLAGVKYMAGVLRNQGHPLSIEHTHIEISPDGESWLGNAICEDLATHEKRAGHFEQPRKYSSGQLNPFAYTLAGSKAERNAMRHFMPESAIVKGKEAWEKLNPGRSATLDITAEATVTTVPSNASTKACNKCGKPIIFVKEGGKTVPKNPDGSKHDDP